MELAWRYRRWAASGLLSSLLWGSRTDAMRCDDPEQALLESGCDCVVCFYCAAGL